MLSAAGGSTGVGGTSGGVTPTVPVATQTRLGVIKVGDHLTIQPDGTLAVEIMTAEEVDEICV